MAKKYSEELKGQVVEEYREVGNAVVVGKKHGISDKTIHNWIKKADELKSNPLKKENKKLRSELEDAHLELAILKDLLKKTYQT